MGIYTTLHKVISSLGGLLLILYQLSKINKNDMILSNLKKYMLDTPYVEFSNFILLSFSHLLLNILGSTKNKIASNLKGLLGCFLSTYAFMIFMQQLYICYEYYVSEIPIAKENLYLCIYLMVYFVAMCAESNSNMSSKKKYLMGTGKTINVEV
ncbi:conserved Plasmodium membrane protein, unknown function [Plasmodium berghei]|uniref:Uncharacterized protein n=2 Tax=Plasmodium berghei TaxID=5821 RepID=A0A509ARC1_PLABA|nr:conserved Plasmodium membrane protein, unknown function [Plasmodium berghei ANKA]CXI82617.1 conserved Plasmodium membrane protein, unknown function [Plasmodium berghei]SCM25641.1 conserved Plasmodium membrane protein, unknown function [Plasmodium berghei]SCN27432.1 conserved Plasmodium membrane protein, unknown function [Plasmodium berghei]SCO62124.1 conserved Plasmodium membrane protein, unknown function [Plasmodium berghei]SCO63859.1 conserved Plasmodium membrane protein, unknown function|eukprot:XP_034423064.1 conserved Plasmodium membrane protein, unknown function [Plasmodium berghei ANKA]